MSRATEQLTVDVKLIARIPDNVDIAVLELDDDVSPRTSVKFSFDQVAYSQEAFFLGFPYGIGFHTEGVNLLPLVKRATLSGSRRSDGAHLIYLDGINNPGFSGGPVIFNVPQTSSQAPQIGAVISGYRPSQDLLLVQGVKVEDAVVLANSGIIHAFDIVHATDAIEAHESGEEVPTKSWTPDIA
jgi:hypothetical protein